MLDLLFSPCEMKSSNIYTAIEVYMTTLQSNLKRFFSLLLFIYSFIGYGQSEQLSNKISEQLETIDDHIDLKEYTQAMLKLEALEKYDEYIKKDENRLLINFIKAKIYYGDSQEKVAIDLLLGGLDEFNLVNAPNLKIDYINYLGDIFLLAKDFNKSRDYYRTIIKDSYARFDTISILESFLSIGKTFYVEEKNDSSIYYWEKVIDFPETKKTITSISKAYNNLSVIAVEDNDLEQAEEYSNKSLKGAKEEKDKFDIAKAQNNLANILYQKGEFREAKLKYFEAYELIKDEKNTNGIILKEILLYNLSYANEELKNFEEAYFYLVDATTLKDSISEINRTRNRSEIDAKYNVEKVEREAEVAADVARAKRQRTQFLFYAAIFAFISVLVLSYIFYRNYRLKRQMEVDKLINDSQVKIINATIDAKEMERKSIAEILHDSVSALLSSANLHLQATKAQLKTGYPQEITKAQTIVNEASVKIRDLSHDLISSVLLKFGLAFAVHDMCQKYSNSEIAFFSDDDGVKRYEQDFEIKIHSIIEELVNNILKHSKAKNASIMLAHRENNMLSIRINDDGVGFDAKKAKIKGGLGLSHIDARITVMKGVFNIVSSKDNGTSIFILVPIIPRA